MFVRPNVIRTILAVDNGLYWCSHQWERFTWWLENIKWGDVLDVALKLAYTVAITFGLALLAVIVGWTGNRREWASLLVPWAIMTGIVLKWFITRWIWRRVVRWAELQQQTAIEIAEKLEGKRSA